MKGQPDNAELSRLELLKTRALCSFREALEKRWPEGTTVAVLLNSRQRVPSLGTVVYWGSDGRGHVRLTKPDRRGRNRVKAACWRNFKP